MTREQYFEMCEAMGSEPEESEIPLEFSDLILEVQEVIHIYNLLQDEWDYMNGNYIGKNFTYIEPVFRMYEVPQELHKVYFELLVTVDRIRAKQIQDSKPKPEQKARP
jgi:hypothetical protein